MVAPRPDDVQLQAKHPVSEEALFRRSGGVKELLYTLKYSHGRIAAKTQTGVGLNVPFSLTHDPEKRPQTVRSGN